MYFLKDYEKAIFYIKTSIASDINFATVLSNTLKYFTDSSNNAEYDEEFLSHLNLLYNLVDDNIINTIMFLYPERPNSIPLDLTGEFKDCNPDSDTDN